MKKIKNCKNIIKAARGGSKETLTQLFAEYEQLLSATARRYGSGHAYQDAYQEACIAFMEAISLWQADLGVPFPAFAKAKVRGDVRTAMRRNWRYEERRILARNNQDETESVNEIWDASANHIENGYGVSSGYSNRHGITSEKCPMENVQDVEFALDLSTLVKQAGLSKRENLYLSWLMEGRTPKEMASLAHVSVETVKTWRKRTLQKIRGKLEFLMMDGLGM